MVYLKGGDISMTSKQKNYIKRKLSKIPPKVVKDIEKCSNGRLAKGIDASTLCKTTR